MGTTKLRLDDLEVQSFDTTPETEGGSGTVFGAESGYGSCNKSCIYGTCEPPCSAGGTCDEGGACQLTGPTCNEATCPGPYGPCAEDEGCHTVCVEVAREFLAFSRAAGNDLSTPNPAYHFAGLNQGDRWCVCAARWLECLEAGVPAPVSLTATHERTLEIVPLAVLQQHATA